MSNRIVAFLTLVVIFLVWGALTWWYLSKWVSQIVLHISGPKNSTAVLQKGGSTMLETPCSETSCVIDRVPPFSYNLRVSAEGYLPYLEDIEIKSNSSVERTIKLVKDIRLREFHTKDAGVKIARKNTVSAIESASGIVVGGYSDSVYFFVKEKQDSYALKKMSIGWDVSGSGAKTIQIFTTTDTPEVLAFNETDGLAGLMVGKESLIFDARTQKVSVFLGAHPESSAGDGISGRRIRNISRSRDTLIVSTDTGAMFIGANGSIIESPLYDDIFTLPSGEILGLIRSGSTAKKSILSLPDDQKSYVFLEKQGTPRSAVIVSDTELDHFATEESEILTVDTEGGKSVIENITK